MQTSKTDYPKIKRQCVPLGELCKLIKGNSPISKTAPGPYPLVTTREDRKSANSFQFNAEAVCIPLISSTGHGHASLKRVHYQGGQFALGNLLAAALVKDAATLSPRFLMRYLNYTKDRLIVPLMTGAANMSISIDRLATVPVEFPSLTEQERIVRMLDEVEELQKLRTQIDCRTTALISALFYEMFGNPEVALRAGSLIHVCDICDVKGGKRLPKGDDYSEEPTQYRYIRITDIHEGRIDETELRFLKPETQKQIARYTVKEGDLVITIAGTIGVIAPVTASLDGANLTENAAKLVPRFNGKYDVGFLAEVMQTPYVQSQIGTRTGKVTIGKLALFLIEQISLPLPPLPLQEEFAARAREIRTIQAEQAASRKRLDDLFQSMLHRAFNGEL